MIENNDFETTAEFLPELGYIPLDDFFDAYFECRRRKRNTMNAARFEFNYETNLVKLCREVNTGKYKIGPSITFIVERPKKREIFAADFRDRIIHHILISRLNPLFEERFIEDSYSCRAGKGTLYGVQRLKDKIKEFSNNYTTDCYIGKFDIHGFFMSINKKLLYKKLEEFIKKFYHGLDKELILKLTQQVVLHSPQLNCKKKSPDTAWDNLPANKSLFTCDPDCGLPIGNLTSQCFANFFLNDFDHWMSNMFNGYYGRYVDDFYVIARTKDEIVKRIEKIRRYLKKKLKLELHKDKIYVQHYSKGVKFIGTVVKKDRSYLGNQTRGNLMNMINRFNRLPVNYETANDFYHSLNSYLGFMKYTDSFNVIKDVWDYIDRKWKTGILRLELRTKSGINYWIVKLHSDFHRRDRIAKDYYNDDLDDFIGPKLRKEEFKVEGLSYDSKLSGEKLLSNLTYSLNNIGNLIFNENEEENIDNS